MKKIISIHLFAICMLSVISCDNSINNKESQVSAHASDERYSAPFGLRWGESLDSIKGEIIGKYEVIEDQKTCPLIKIKTKNIKSGIRELGEYELTILPKYENVNFSGLTGVEYRSEPNNETSYNYLVTELVENLKRKYGEPKDSETKNKNEIYYFFEKENELQVSFFAGQSEGYFHVSLYYVFFPIEHQESLKQKIDTIKEDCLKQRNPL